MTMGLGPQVETCAEREGHGAVACKALGAVGPVRQNKVLCTSSRVCCITLHQCRSLKYEFQGVLRTVKYVSTSRSC